MPQEPAIVESPHSSSARVQILLADDFEPWRSKVRSFLEDTTQWKILEASDGLEAVEKTVELHPEVVLLDVNMPGLNGLEAAKEICRLSPDSKIVFLSQNTDEEVINAAFEAGAVGYVIKREMIKELVPAIQAALLTRP